MKKIILFAMVLCLCGCSSGESSEETESIQDPEEVIEYRDVYLDITEQMITENGTFIELAQFEGDDEDENIETVNLGLTQEYQDLVYEYGENDICWIEYYTYPMTNERYVNLVSTYNIYPTYGTYGVVESTCYDKLDGCFIDEVDALEIADLTEDEIDEAIGEYITSTEPATPIGSENIAFYISEDDQVTFIVAYNKTIEDAGEWIAFYSYDGDTVEYLGEGNNLIDVDLLDDTDTNIPLVKQDIVIDTIVCDSADEEYLIDICRQYTVDHYALTTPPEDLAVQELSEDVINGHTGKFISVMSPNDDLQEYVEFFICDDENRIYEYDVVTDSYSILYSENNG